MANAFCEALAASVVVFFAMMIPFIVVEVIHRDQSDGECHEDYE